MQAQRWYLKFPGNPYAYGPVDFGRPVGESEARTWARDWAGVNRLPSGFQCWPA